MPIWSENSGMSSQGGFNFYPRLFTSRWSAVQPNGANPAPILDYNNPHSANPRDIRVQSPEQGNQSPAQISPSITNTEPGGLQLEQLSKPELIEVVMRLQAELSRASKFGCIPPDPGALFTGWPDYPHPFSLPLGASAAPHAAIVRRLHGFPALCQRRSAHPYPGGMADQPGIETSPHPNWSRGF